MAHYGFVIDQKGCIACHTCAVACKVENNLPDGNWWSRILTGGGAIRIRQRVFSLISPWETFRLPANIAKTQHV